MIVILGAGLAGLSTSHHLKHNCLLLEKKSHVGGHIHSQKINEFTWDEGPHVSFTKHEHVKNLFANSCEFVEFPVFPTNYYKGHWIPHPAQANLYAIPEPKRAECLDSFLKSRLSSTENAEPENYKQWLEMAFGEAFASEFPANYTVKYWTTTPENLTTDWVGDRVFYPNVEEVKQGAIAAPDQSKHYITSVRYPKNGGYFSYANTLKQGAKVQTNAAIVAIDLKAKNITLNNGDIVAYSTLINTLPLPDFVRMTAAPKAVIEAANALSCSEVLLINLVVNHPPSRKNQWLYVYDIEKYSTRINFTDLLAESNGVAGKCGIQVEVYFSKYRPQTESLTDIVSKVCEELIEMELVSTSEAIEEVNTQKISYANVIFDHQRRASLTTIFEYLQPFGLAREKDDLEAMTDWNTKLQLNEKLGELILAGRFGQWKYYWTDDCVMRGLQIATAIG